MNKYRVFETDEFLKRVEKLDSQNKSFIMKKLASYVYPQLKFLLLITGRMHIDRKQSIITDNHRMNTDWNLTALNSSSLSQLLTDTCQFQSALPSLF